MRKRERARICWGHERHAHSPTLSLIFYGDLDITTISDKPKERQEIATSIISASRYEDMLDYIGREVRAGKQAYFVCSKIDEDDEEGTLISVKELFEELKNRLPFVRFALLHGKMKDKEKSEIMQAFKDGKYDCPRIDDGHRSGRGRAERDDYGHL